MIVICQLMLYYLLGLNRGLWRKLFTGDDFRVCAGVWECVFGCFMGNTSWIWALANRFINHLALLALSAFTRLLLNSSPCQCEVVVKNDLSLSRNKFINLATKWFLFFASIVALTISFFLEEMMPAMMQMCHICFAVIFFPSGLKIPCDQTVIR